MTTEDVDNFPTMFMLNSAESLPQDLRGREADAPSEQWSSPISSGDTLSFVFTTSAGNKAEGMALMEPNGVAVKDCTCAEAAEFAYWVQATVLPSQAAMYVNMTEGVEWEFPSIELPRAEVQELQHLLTERLRQILDGAYSTGVYSNVSVIGRYPNDSMATWSPIRPRLPLIPIERLVGGHLAMCRKYSPIQNTQGTWCGIVRHARER